MVYTPIYNNIVRACRVLASRSVYGKKRKCIGTTTVRAGGKSNDARVYPTLTVYLSFRQYYYYYYYIPYSNIMLYLFFNGRHDLNFDFNEPSSR